MFTADGKQATVKYDSSKKMFYIEWSGSEQERFAAGVKCMRCVDDFGYA